MKTHASLGYEMLKHSNKRILQAAAIVSKEHHEKYNGKGLQLSKRLRVRLALPSGLGQVIHCGELDVSIQ